MHVCVAHSTATWAGVTRPRHKPQMRAPCVPCGLINAGISAKLPAPATGQRRLPSGLLDLESALNPPRAVCLWFNAMQHAKLRAPATSNQQCQPLAPGASTHFRRFRLAASTSNWAARQGTTGPLAGAPRPPTGPDTGPSPLPWALQGNLRNLRNLIIMLA
jgi:hypothetical protein